MSTKKDKLKDAEGIFHHIFNRKVALTYLCVIRQNALVINNKRGFQVTLIRQRFCLCKVLKIYAFTKVASASYINNVLVLFEKLIDIVAHSADLFIKVLQGVSGVCR